MSRTKQKQDETQDGEAADQNNKELITIKTKQYSRFLNVALDRNKSVLKMSHNWEYHVILLHSCEENEWAKQMEHFFFKMTANN